MNITGWILFVTANVAVLSLIIFCFSKVFSVPKTHVHSTLEIDTKDTNDSEENQNN